MATGAAKRFGARYGRTVRQKFADIEAEQRKKFKCPYCHNFKVKRVASGIWQCRKCNAKFTGKAYTIPKKIVLKQEIKKQEIEEKPEKQEVKEKEEIKEEISEGQVKKSQNSAVD